MDVVSCLTWLPRKYCDSDFFKNYIHKKDPESDFDVVDSEDDVENKQQFVDDFDLDHYDDDDLLPNEQMFTMTHNDENLIEEDEEDVQARKLDESDRVIVAGLSTDHFSSMVVYLYDVDTCGLEPNHSIQLGSFPLCCEVVGDVYNFPLLAVGTFEPEINLWNLSEINQLTPCVTLDDNLPENDSVLSLSHSPNINNLLASGYSDNKVRVWDLRENTMLQSFDHHTDKVQVVSWNPKDPSLLFTGAFDKKLTLIDKELQWFGLENGEVFEYDWVEGKEVWRIKSHKKSCTGLTKVKDLLVTCGLDSIAKVYRMNEGEPILVEEKNLKSRPLFSSSPSMDDEYLLSFGGNNLVIWDLETIEHLNKQ